MRAGDARARESERVGNESAPAYEQRDAPGATVPVEVLGDLSRGWYGGRLDDEWRPSSVAAKQEFLREAGLSGAFWELG